MTELCIFTAIKNIQKWAQRHFITKRLSVLSCFYCYAAYSYAKQGNRLCDFSPIGLFWMPIVTLKRSSSLKKWWHFGLLLRMVCCKHFQVLKKVWCRCFGLLNWAFMLIFCQLGAWWLFGLLFPKFWQFFTQTSGHPDGKCPCANIQLL